MLCKTCCKTNKRFTFYNISCFISFVKYLDVLIFVLLLCKIMLFFQNFKM